MSKLTTHNRLQMLDDRNYWACPTLIDGMFGQSYLNSEVGEFLSSYWAPYQSHRYARQVFEHSSVVSSSLDLAACSSSWLDESSSDASWENDLDTSVESSEHARRGNYGL